MATAAFSFLQKIVKQREYLLRKNIGNTSAEVRSAFMLASNYVKCMAMANETAVRTFIKKYKVQLEKLIPHNDKNQSLFEQLNQYAQ